MSVKKIMAPSMPEAFQKVKEEVGEEAVILSSRIVWTKGFLGLFKKKQFEVIAVTDEDSYLQTEKAANTFVEFDANAEPKQEVDESMVLSELAELKRMVEAGQKLADPKLSVYPATIKKALRKLLDQEVDEVLVQDIADELLQKWREMPNEPSEEKVMLDTKRTFITYLEKLPFNKKALNKKFIALVGPTGVGKTTTLAKLAAHASLEEKKKVAFITLDTYRIAAIDQLKTYAALLNIPVEVAYEPEDFLKAAESFSDYDQIFIDTAGRNFRDSEFVHALNNILSQEDELETFLVLSVTMKERDIEPIMNNFKHMEVKQLIFTKADETNVYGSMVNMMLKYRLAAAYVTTGQDVPDDITDAQPKLFADYIFGDVNE